MRILFVLTQSLDSPSGLGRFGPMARELVKRGYAVELVALHPAWDQLAEKQFVESGVHVKYVAQMHVRKVGDRKLYLGPLPLLWVSLLAIMRLTAAVWRSQAEVLLLCKPQPFNSIAVRLARRGRVLLCDCDDYEAETNQVSADWQRRVLQFFEDGIIHQADFITVNTQFLRKRYETLGFPPQKIIYIPNGVEPSRFSLTIDVADMKEEIGLPANAQVVGYFGTIGLLSHPLQLLLEAFVLLREQCPLVWLLLVGGGEDFDRLQEMAAELGIAERVRFVGRVAPERLPAYVAVMDVSVDPVYDDGIAQARSPLKIVESFMMGTPVVTAAVGDRPFLLSDNKLGELVEAGQPAALAIGLQRILAMTPYPAARRRFIQEWAAQWDWSRLIDDLDKVFSASIERG
jgi:glycosyltransferase involved in cell wall biosynthesis